MAVGKDLPAATTTQLQESVLLATPQEMGELAPSGQSVRGERKGAPPFSFHFCVLSCFPLCKGS